MAPSLLLDLSKIDLSRSQLGVDEIERINPHRGVMRLLDGINYISDDCNEAVAFKDVGADEFWVPGHIPGRPIFPGVLMIEAAAQLASYLTLRRLTQVKFMGFVGIEGVKFRGQVAPGDRFHVLGVGLECRLRRSICKAQGVVNGNLVFEALITGMPL